jgi:hypothetical protein
MQYIEVKCFLLKRFMTIEPPMLKSDVVFKCKKSFIGPFHLKMIYKIVTLFDQKKKFRYLNFKMYNYFVLFSAQRPSSRLIHSPAML